MRNPHRSLQIGVRWIGGPVTAVDGRIGEAERVAAHVGHVHQAAHRHGVAIFLRPGRRYHSVEAAVVKDIAADVRTQRVASGKVVYGEQVAGQLFAETRMPPDHRRIVAFGTRTPAAVDGIDAIDVVALAAHDEFAGDAIGHVVMA